MIDWDTFKAQLQTNPGKLLKSVLMLAGCFLAIWILVILQSNPSTQNNIRVQESGRLDSLQISTFADAEEPTQSSPASGSGRAFDMSAMLPLILFFLICVAGVWFWMRSKNNASLSNPPSRLFNTVGSQQLPGGQQLVVIKLNSEYWVMTTGGTEGMKLLHRYHADEWQGPTSQPPKKDWMNTFKETLQTSPSAKRDRE